MSTEVSNRKIEKDEKTTTTKGPMQSLSIDGNKYFISFIDDSTRFTVLYFFKKKSRAFNKYIYKLQSICRKSMST